jgi:glycerate 2-kinase
VLSAAEAAAALAEGLRSWADADELPVADGGEGTLDVVRRAVGGEWRTATVHDAFARERTAHWLWQEERALVEAAQAIPLDETHLDAVNASSRGLGELILAVGAPPALVVCLGGTASVDGGAGLREVLHELPAPTTVLCDVDAPLVDAARVYARQKGATDEQVSLLAERLLSRAELESVRTLPGAGAAGGLGAALAALGGQLEPGAARLLDLIGFDPTAYDLVITGEGTVDVTSVRGKAPGEVARRCREAGVRCVVFGGRVVEPLPGARTVALSGDPAAARADLTALGRALGAAA